MSSKASGSSKEPYRQVLPDLELSIERFTENVPADGQWHLLRSGAVVGRFRSLKAAQEAWREIVRESGWKPAPSTVDVEDVRRREQVERWSRNRGG
jgi:hypothetical protein